MFAAPSRSVTTSLSIAAPKLPERVIVEVDEDGIQLDLPASLLFPNSSVIYSQIPRPGDGTWLYPSERSLSGSVRSNIDPNRLQVEQRGGFTPYTAETNLKARTERNQHGTMRGVLGNTG